jgi:hypothetical protein
MLLDEDYHLVIEEHNWYITSNIIIILVGIVMWKVVFSIKLILLL